MFDDWDFSHSLMSPSYNELVGMLNQSREIIARIEAVINDPPAPSRMLIPFLLEAIHGPSDYEVGEDGLV